MSIINGLRHCRYSVYAYVTHYLSSLAQESEDLLSRVYGAAEDAYTGSARPATRPRKESACVCVLAYKTVL